MLVGCPVHTPVSTHTYGLPLSQSDQRLRTIFQSVYNNILLLTEWGGGSVQEYIARSLSVLTDRKEGYGQYIPALTDQLS